MQIKSWHIAMVGAAICFIFPFYMAILASAGEVSQEGTIFNELVSATCFIIAIIMSIPAALLKSKTKKKAGAILSMIFGTAALTIWHLSILEKEEMIDSLVISFLILLPGILLVVASILFFGKENAQSCRKKPVGFITFLLSIAIFTPSMLIALSGINFDSNSEIKKCQYRNGMPLMVVATLKGALGMGYESYQKQVDLGCYRMIAMKNLDLELCERLPENSSTNRNRTDCLIYIASQKNDSSICLKTNNISNCYLKVAEEASRRKNISDYQHRKEMENK